MDMIQENPFMRILHAIIPPMVCFGFFFMTGAMLLDGIMDDDFDHSSVALAAGVFLSLLMGILIKVFWHKSFLYKILSALDGPNTVEWDTDMIHFRGAYLDYKVSPYDVLDYKVYWIFSTSVRIRVKVENKVLWIWLSTTMPDKKKFIDFLETVRKTPPPPPVTARLD